MTGQSTERSSKSGAGNKSKVQRPHRAFKHPAEVVADPDLSKDQKRTALASLEQDAKQLAVATDEGMSGGEDTNLRDVLVAKETLDLPPSETAFSVVTQTLESKLAASQGTDLHGVIAHAIDSLKAARDAIGRMNDPSQLPPGAARPGSKQELEEELAKEKLDP